MLFILQKWSEIHSNWCGILRLPASKIHNILYASKGPQQRTYGPFPVTNFSMKTSRPTVLYSWSHGQLSQGQQDPFSSQFSSNPLGY